MYERGVGTERRRATPVGWGITHSLGADRFGQRYLVENAGKFRQRAVLHRLHQRLADHRTYRDAVRSAAALVAKVRHPNLATVLGFGTDRAGLFVLTELPHGTSVDVIIERTRRVGTPLPVDEAMSIARQAAVGLLAARTLCGPSTTCLSGSAFVLPTDLLVGADRCVRLMTAGLAPGYLPPRAACDLPVGDAAAIAQVLVQLLVPRGRASEALEVLFRTRDDVPEAVVVACARALRPRSDSAPMTLEELGEALARRPPSSVRDDSAGAVSVATDGDVGDDFAQPGVLVADTCDGPTAIRRRTKPPISAAFGEAVAPPGRTPTQALAVAPPDARTVPVVRAVTPTVVDRPAPPSPLALAPSPPAPAPLAPSPLPRAPRVWSSMVPVRASEWDGRLGRPAPCEALDGRGSWWRPLVVATAVALVVTALLLQLR